jgi:hypothetical protein
MKDESTPLITMNMGDERITGLCYPIGITADMDAYLL